MGEEVLPDFLGKLVVFYITGAGATSWGDSGVVMDFIDFRRIGNRLFVVGRLPQAVGAEWVWSLQSGIAWDSVAHYLVFDSLEDYQRRTAKAKPGLFKRVFKGEAG